MTTVVLSLGSNQGDRLGYLRGAVAGLGEAVLAVSGVYEAPAWPPGDPSPPYLNATVLAADPALDARGWLHRAQELETAAGRQRDPRRRYAPRTLDIDVIMVVAEDQPVIRDEADLILPHPRAHLRAFVLRPWIDIQPYARLPGHGPLTDLLREEAVAADLAHLRARPDLTLESGV
jgi:2-amino-4-hydroxy-6-hydroxymethyldihydropteridine diphosphokinase